MRSKNQKRRSKMKSKTAAEKKSEKSVPINSLLRRLKTAYTAGLQGLAQAGQFVMQIVEREGQVQAYRTIQDWLSCTREDVEALERIGNNKLLPEFKNHVIGRMPVAYQRKIKDGALVEYWDKKTNKAEHAKWTELTRDQKRLVYAVKRGQVEGYVRSIDEQKAMCQP